MKEEKRRRRGWLYFLLCAVIIVFLIVDSNMRIETTEYEVESGRIPEAFDGFRIIQLSDLHGDEFGKDNSRLIKAVKAARPDIITITGDLIDSPGQGEYAKKIAEKLVEIAPVFYVTGNHEWASGEISELFDILNKAGVTVLRNDYVLLESKGEYIVLAGLDDPNGPYDMKTPEEVFSDIYTAEGGKYMVLLNHRNDGLERFASLGADLVMSGHAHGGVIRFPFTDGLIGPSMDWLPTFTSGVYTDGDTVMIVSRGLGNSPHTLRVFNNPHLPVVVLKAANT
ncbi:MAG: metallophosphoesterase [Oscillospiraceae bacterium]